MPLTQKMLLLFCLCICMLSGMQSKAENISLKIKQLSDSASYYEARSPKKAGMFATEGLALAKAENNWEAIAKFLNTKAFVYYKLNNNKAALQHAMQALEISKKQHSTSNLIRSYTIMGAVYAKQAEYIKAQKMYLTALALADKESNKADKAMVMTWLGLTHLYMGHYISALNYYRQCRQIYTEQNNLDLTGQALHNMGNVFKAQNNSDSASYYMLQAANIFLKTGNNAELLHVYNNIGTIFTNNEQHKLALAYYNKCLYLIDSLGNDWEIGEVLGNIGTSYLNLGQNKLALEYFMRAKKIAEQTNSRELRANMYYNLSLVYEELGELKKSVTYSRSYADLRDSTFTEESSRLLAEMSEKYEAAQKEKQIKQLTTQKALQQSEITVRTQQRNLIILSASVILVVLSFIAYSLRQKLKLNKLRAQQTEEKNRQAINNLLKEQEINAISAMIQGQELERQRVAEDLHDRLGSLLSTVKLNFSGLEKKANNGLADSDQYKKGIYLLDEACSEVRKIAYDMASGVLQKYGFVTAVEELKASIESSNMVKVHFYKYNAEQPIDKDTEINLYRITQELVSNILKHAGATEIHIQYSIIYDTINLIVEDNGRGFDTSAKTGRNGMGIGNIQARVNKLDGSIDFDSSIGRGTIAILNIPVKSTSLTSTITQAS